MIYLLDTDIFLYLLRGSRIVAPRNEGERERQTVARRILRRCQQAAAANDVLALSAISIAELEYGARRSLHYESNMEALREVLSPFAALDFDAVNSAAHYGEIRHVLESAGNSIGGMDLLIAGHARSLGATLVTNNTREFSRVPGLKCENWRG